MCSADAPSTAPPGADPPVDGPRPDSEATIENLRRQVAELTEAVNARDAFIAVAGHELRNPMTPIRAQVDLLLRQVKSGRAGPERLEAGLERAAWMIEQYVRRATTLLDVSRLTSGKLIVEAKPVHLATIVREVVNSLAPIARHGGSAVTVDVSDAIIGTWDRLAMEQIIENLVSNAIKYGAGKPIAVSAEVVDERLRFQVRDQGIGISERDRARVFERFERAVGRGEHGGGFGVGLWIVRQLAQAMGGDIDIDGAVGKGTTLTVSIPLDAKDRDD